MQDPAATCMATILQMPYQAKQESHNQLRRSATAPVNGRQGDAPGNDNVFAGKVRSNEAKIKESCAIVKKLYI